MNNKKTNSSILKRLAAIALAVAVMLSSVSCSKNGFDGIPPEQFRSESPLFIGEQLGFSPIRINHFYGQLSQKQKEIYINLYNAVESMEKGDVFLANEVTNEDVTTAVSAYFADNPHHFWIAESLETCWTDTNNLGIFFNKLGNGITSFLGLSEKKTDFTEYTDAYCKLSYIYKNTKQRDEAAEQLRTSMQEILQGVSPESELFERELFLHDRLAEVCTYDHLAFEEFLENGSVGERINCHTAYGALVNKTATCAGYARAMQLLLGEAGIENKLITGTRNDERASAQVAHAWNVVYINGAPYHLDVTGDDKDGWGVANGAYVRVSEDGADYHNVSNRTEHRYFNITDEQISLDHQGFVPQLAMSDRSNYYAVKQLSFVDTDASVKQGIIDELMLMSGKNAFYIEFYAGLNANDQQQYLNVLVNGEDGMMYECLSEVNLMLAKSYYREDLIYYGLDEASGIISVCTVPFETIG